MSRRAFKRQRLLIFPVLFCGQLTQGFAGVSEKALIESIRVGNTPENTRVVFDLSKAVSFKLSILQNPPRVVIDLIDTTNDQPSLDLNMAGTYALSVKSSITSHNLRYVFHVKPETDAKAFALKPHIDRGNRVVLDLAPSSTPVDKAEVNALAERPERKKRANPENEDFRLSGSQEKIPSSTGAWSGNIDLESTLFFDSPQYSEQSRGSNSISFEAEYYVDWDGNKQRFSFRPFFRYDSADSERTSFDVRELYWRIEHESFLLKAGVDVVFWGVAESQHLIDVINQTDLVHDIDGEEKLGQPMINLDYYSEYGDWQLYVLPFFRDRTFPGEDGRLRTEPTIDPDNSLYESSKEENHVDFAVRWSHYFGDWDVGVSHFSGTSRTPIPIPSGNAGNPGFTPLYLQIEQTSIDVQATKDAWLWKLEALHNQNSFEDYSAYVAGLEYTYYGLADTAWDMGLLLEYNFDDSDENPLVLFDDDIYMGVRFTGNDVASTSFLAGILIDADTRASFLSIEAARRLGEDWSVTVESRVFSNFKRTNLLYSLSSDDYIRIRLSRYF